VKKSKKVQSSPRLIKLRDYKGRFIAPKNVKRGQKVKIEYYKITKKGNKRTSAEVPRVLTKFEKISFGLYDKIAEKKILHGLTPRDFDFSMSFRDNLYRMYPRHSALDIAGKKGAFINFNISFGGEHFAGSVQVAGDWRTLLSRAIIHNLADRGYRFTDLRFITNLVSSDMTAQKNRKYGIKNRKKFKDLKHIPYDFRCSISFQPF
jgi:hypothetical protein